jgi:acetolactate synthase-1/2/3 large subunit
MSDRPQRQTTTLRTRARAEGAAERSGARALVECLLAQGAQRIFGVPGESYLGVLDALYDKGDRIALTPNRHEGGAAFMAEAWGKLTGAPGLCFVTRGPGAANAAIGVHTAMQSASPMILFIGQVATGMRGREAFQEIDHRAFFGPIAKWATEVDAADRIPEIVARAFAVAQSGRPGPVVVALPEDVLAASTAAPAGPRVRVPRAAPAPADLGELACLLEAARAPLVLAGGGGWSAQGRADLRSFLEANRLPALAGPRFQDVLDHASPAYVGDAGLGKAAHVRALFQDADLVLAINLRFGEITTDGWTLLRPPDPAPVLVHAHASDAELNKIYTADLPIHAHPDLLAAALRDLRLDAAERWAARTAQARAAQERLLDLPAPPGPLDMRAVMRHLGEALPDDAIVTNGAGNFAIWPNKHLAFTGARRLIAPQSGAMGYGLPAAIAARLAHPERCVLAFVGDGDFQMTATELGTALQAGARPIVLILNNASYGTIRMHQEATFPGRVSFTDLVNPDFVALAAAYGLHAERVERTADFAPAFARARAADGAVIELVVPVEAITPRTTLTALRAAAGRAD